MEQAHMVDCLRSGDCRLEDTVVSAIPDLDHLGSLDLILLHGFFICELDLVASYVHISAQQLQDPVEVKSKAQNTRCEELSPLAWNCLHHHNSKIKSYQEINYFRPNQAKFLPAVSVDYNIFKI